MNNKSIGVFDSGLGGLTAVKQIMQSLPNEDIIYFGDTGRVPYGTRSPETILKYTRGDIRFLNSFGVKIIVIACGTASSVALPGIKDEFDTPIVGVVESAVYAAVHTTQNNKIGIIGTPGTIKSGSYENLIKAHDGGIKTFTRACPLFVPLVENGHFDTEMTRLAVDEYLCDIRKAGVDTLIMGCTHYPLLRKAIADYMGDGVTLIDPGAETAKYLQRKMNDEMRHEETGGGNYSYYVSDNTDGFEELGGIFLEREISGRVEKIDIEKY